MKGHVEEGGWVSCSMDSFGTPRQLERRRAASVKRNNGKYLLTKVDSAITKQFTCNSPIKWITGLAAMVITVVAIASGPVGWVALGAASVIAVTAVVASHQCNGGLEGTEWVDFHATVKYDKQEVILYYHSTLVCSKKGILIASETFEQANNLSNQMALNNWKSNAVNIGENIINGWIGGPVFCAINLTIEVGVSVIDNNVLSLVNSTIWKPGTATEYATIMKSPILSVVLLKEWAIDSINIIKGIASNPQGFISAMKIAPRVTMQMAFSYSLLAEMGKGLGKGLATMAVTFVADKIEEWIETHNGDLINELKSLKSGKNIISLNY